MPNIKFTTTEYSHTICPPPLPASKAVPKWYKDMPRGRKDQSANFEATSCPYNVDPELGIIRNSTLKECIPVRDYITSGYVIPLWSSLGITQNEQGFDQIYWLDETTMKVQTHHLQQVIDCPITKELKPQATIFKFISPWQIHTPPGYSSLIFSPRYNSSAIEILPAIVDTDECSAFNFPFIVNRSRVNEKEITVECGEPIIQVIPFKRESWTHDIEVVSYDKFDGAAVKLFTYIHGAYRKMMHRKKTYL